jgi:hypothetical protein
VVAINLERLRELQQDRTVTVDGIGEFRLRLLDAACRLRVLSGIATLPRNDAGEIASQSDALSFGAELLSLAIVDDDGIQCFDSEGGRQSIARLPLASMQEMVDVALDMNGLRAGDMEAERGRRQAAKKNSKRARS